MKVLVIANRDRKNNFKLLNKLRSVYKGESLYVNLLFFEDEYQASEYPCDELHIIKNENSYITPKHMADEICSYLKLNEYQIIIAHNNKMNNEILAYLAYEKSCYVLRNALELEIHDQKIQYIRIDKKGENRSFFEILLDSLLLISINTSELSDGENNKINKVIGKNIVKYFELMDIQKEDKALKLLGSYRVDKKENLDFESDIVFSGGRGLSEKDFKLLRDIAKHYKANVAGTRPCVDLGYIKYEEQVGQTGKTISPKVYLAFGISGAIQHMIGLKNIEKIISVNNNPSANIFRHSDYFVVGDASKVLKEMKESINTKIQTK